VLSQLSYTPTAGYCTSFSISYAAICNDSLAEVFGALGWLQNTRGPDDDIEIENAERPRDINDEK
jgi:hypothetical protein